VEIGLIAPPHEANEVTEEDSSQGRSRGGTFISSGYVKALELHPGALATNPSLWKRLLLPLLGRDNFDSDNPAALRERPRSWPRCLQPLRLRRDQAVGSPTTKGADDATLPPARTDNFQTVLSERKEDTGPSFKAFLARTGACEQGA